VLPFVVVKLAVDLHLPFNSGCFLLGFSLQYGQHLTQHDSITFNEFVSGTLFEHCTTFPHFQSNTLHDIA